MERCNLNALPATHRCCFPLSGPTRPRSKPPPLRRQACDGPSLLPLAGCLQLPQSSLGALIKPTHAHQAEQRHPTPNRQARGTRVMLNACAQQQSVMRVPHTPVLPDATCCSTQHPVSCTSESPACFSIAATTTSIPPASATAALVSVVATYTRPHTPGGTNAVSTKK